MADYAFDSKRSDETVILSIDFKNVLRGASIASAVEWTVTVESGTDPNPSNILSGIASYAGTEATHKIVGGVDGVTYALLIGVTTDNGQTLKLLATLTIDDSV